MNEKFFNLSKEKQDRMINSALRAFARNGYDHASTDEMVQEAGISKGLLFHYFNSKRGLYFFVYEYSVRFMLLEFSHTIKKQEKDLFEIQRQMEKARIQVMQKYPYMQLYLNGAFLDGNEEMTGEISALMDRYSKALQTYYGQADLSGFREGTDPSMVLKMMVFTIEGLVKENFRKKEPQGPEALFQEITEYIDLMKQNFYEIG